MDTFTIQATTFHVYKIYKFVNQYTVFWESPRLN